MLKLRLSTIFALLPDLIVIQKRYRRPSLPLINSIVGSSHYLGLSTWLARLTESGLIFKMCFPITSPDHPEYGWCISLEEHVIDQFRYILRQTLWLKIIEQPNGCCQAFVIGSFEKKGYSEGIISAPEIYSQTTSITAIEAFEAVTILQVRLLYRPTIGC